VSKAGVRILDAGEIGRALERVAAAIGEQEPNPPDLILVGIRTRGVPLAERLADLLASEGRRPRTGSLDINLYRDDLSSIGDHPVLHKTEIPFDVDGSRIVLVDDVLYTGRTIRAALDGLIDLGRPQRVQLAVLIDRGHREIPIQPDFVGRRVETTRDQQVEVRLSEVDGADEVLLHERGGRSDATA
jgi:pyrimidine operon attenuation protein/uracil phosphoribosyltransferase